jgi:predicted nucleotidyltransferase component of viral defense system
MRDQALARARGTKDPGQALNLLREYLQTLILRSFHECEAFQNLAFVGGSALRFLYNLPRFSEDLDFSIVHEKGYAGMEWMSKVKRDLSLAGFNPLLTWNDRKVVHTGWIRLAGLLYDAGISGLPDQKLAIKLEIDTRPPAGAHCERSIITRNVTFLLQHYDLPSMMAGKLHAAITRKYVKGRDWYDLLWYRTQRPPIEPNVELLQKALDQTHRSCKYDARKWQNLVKDRLASLNIKNIADDILPFLEHPQDASLLTREYLSGMF